MLSRSDKLKRKKINKFLSFIVICVTLSILILPAFTLEKKDDDTNDNNGPTTVENVNEQGGAETLGDSTLEPVINNNDDETNTIANENTDVVLAGKEDVSITNNDDHSTVEDDVLNVEETIDDEYTVDEEPVLMAEGTTVATKDPLVLTQDNIESITLTYHSTDGTDKNIDNGEITDFKDRYLKIKVNFHNIYAKNLVENHSRSFKYKVPEFLRILNNVNGYIYNGSVKVGTITINETDAIIKYNDDRIVNPSEDTVLNGDFYIEGEINLSKLNTTDGKIAFANSTKNITLNYGEDYLQKFGELNINKSFSNDVKNDDYIKYTITVSAGKDGANNVYVVDKFTNENNLVSYTEMPKTETILSDVEDSQKPFETKGGGSLAGKIYLTNNPNYTNSIPEQVGESGIVSEAAGFVWNIGNMNANETRTLTYFVKLKDDKRILSNEDRYKQSIKNDAVLYTKGVSNTIYNKAHSEQTFVPSIAYDMIKNVLDQSGLRYKKNDDGSYTIKYRLTFNLKENSDFPLKNFEFRDDLYYSDFQTNSEALKYIEYDRNSVELYAKKVGELSCHKLEDVQIVWDKASGFEKNTKFTLKGKNSPITINPGDNYYVDYSITVKPEAFAASKSNKIEVKNRYLTSASNAHAKFDSDVLDRVFASTQDYFVTIDEYAWVNKNIGDKIVSGFDVDITGDRYVFVGGTISTGDASVTKFTVPAESYKYTVDVNKTFGLFDVTNVTMTDTLNASFMHYVGYLKITAYNTDDSVVGTKWVNIDGLSTFGLKLKDLDWGNNKYRYVFEYYAKPKDLTAIGQETARNIFNLNGIVTGSNNQEFIFNNVGSYKDIILEGYLTLTMTKHALCYEEPEVSEGPWKNGKLYWLIKIEGNTIKKGTIIKDATLCGDTDYVDNYLREDSIEGIYKGNINTDRIINIEEFKTQYSNIEVTNSLFTQKLEGVETSYLENSYRDLLLTANQDIELGSGNNLYIVVKTEPKKLPSFSSEKSRNYLTYRNRLWRVFADGEQKETSSADNNIYYGGDILKEFGQIVSYDGNTVKQIVAGTDTYKPIEKIKTSLLANTGPGIYAAWAIKLNYAGDMEGDFRILENIPQGMELAYIQLKWHGDFARNVNSMQIDGLDSEWIKKINNEKNDDNYQSSQETIYYVNKTKRQAMMKVGSFTFNKQHDDNSIDIQVVCKITDPQFLLGGQNKTITNTAELLTGDGDKMPANRRDPAIAKSDAMFNKDIFDKAKILDKTHVANGQEINYTITVNQLGQKLPTNTEDENYMMLVDKLGLNLDLDIETVKVKDSSGIDVEHTKSFDPDTNTLFIKIPNGKKVIITYTTNVNVAPNTPTNISNEVYWKGCNKDGGKRDEIVGYSYSLGGTTGSSEKPTLTIKKYDQDNGNPIKGVNFEIYQCTIQDDETISEISKGIGTTNDYGVLEVKLLEYNTLYKVMEQNTPDGYVENNKVYYIACLDNKDDVFKTKCETYNTNHPDNKIKIVYGSSKFKLEVYNSQKGIVVKKAFKNAGGTDINHPLSGIYKFGLYDDSDTLIDTQFITYGTSDTEVNKTVKFTNLDLSKNYHVYELDDSGNPIKNASQGNMINRTEYLTSYATTNASGSTDPSVAASGDTVTVTNQVYTRQLPATGGNGINGYIKSGAILMLLTGVLLLKRRR